MLIGETVFVNNALPGEVVKAQILKDKKSYAFARISEIVKESPDRVKVPLRQYVQTGLASLAHLKYDKQLEFKQKQVKELFEQGPLGPDQGSGNFAKSLGNWLQKQGPGTGQNG